MSKKMNFSSKMVEPLSDGVKPNLSNLTKWLPLLCAGAAAGISIIALKEIKTIRSEINTIKKEPFVDEGLSKKIQTIEEQLKNINEFLKNQNKKPQSNPQQRPQFVRKTAPEVVKNVIPEKKEINIINQDEYEEVEVTDDENEENEEN